MPIRLTWSGDGRERIEAALASAPEPARSIQVLLLRDVSIDDVRGLDQHRSEGEALLVVIAGAASPHVVRSLMAAADGVIDFDAIDRSCGPALSAIDAGLRAFSDPLIRHLRAPELSAREKQVLAMLVLDMSNFEIAAKLHVSESNVKFHLSAAFRKLGVRSRTAAAALILDPDAGLGPGILRITPSQQQTLG